jgi:hypothetical protein
MDRKGTFTLKIFSILWALINEIKILVSELQITKRVRLFDLDTTHLDKKVMLFNPNTIYLNNELTRHNPFDALYNKVYKNKK